MHTSIGVQSALCGVSWVIKTLDEAMALNDQVTFLQAIRAPLIKGDENGGDGRAPKNVNFELRQLLSDALIGRVLLRGVKPEARMP